MKLNILIATLLLSSVASANTCQDLFSEGNSKAEVAFLYAQKAEATFSQMKELAKKNAPSSELCKVGQDSRMAAFLSATNFKKSRAAWLEAIDACSTPNDKTAAEQADENTDHYNTQAEFIASMDNLLGSRCGAKPLTPILNQ